MFSPIVLDHFQNPRNGGQLEKATATGRAENLGCGDLLELSVRIEGDVLTEVRFAAKGCVPTIACGSRITEMAQGTKVSEALKISRDALIGSLGGLPSTSTHAAQLAIDALRAALSPPKRR